MKNEFIIIILNKEKIQHKKFINLREFNLIFIFSFFFGIFAKLLFYLTKSNSLEILSFALCYCFSANFFLIIRRTCNSYYNFLFLANLAAHDVGGRLIFIYGFYFSIEQFLSKSSRF